MTAHEAFVALAAVGGLLLLLGMFAGLIHEKGVLSEPLFALAAGVLIGPAALDLADLAHFGDPQTILEYAALATLAVALMGVALRLPARYSLRNGGLLLVLLGLLMPFSCEPRVQPARGRASEEGRHETRTLRIGSSLGTVCCLPASLGTSRP